MLGIAYRLRLREPEVLGDLKSFVQDQATLRGWRVHEAPPAVFPAAPVRRLDGGLESPRRLDLAGVWVNPHFGADDLCLVFDTGTGELIDASRTAVPGGGAGSASPDVLGFGVTRTTWADALTHVALLTLFEALAENDLASVEMGDPGGGELPREVASAEKRLREVRAGAIRASLERPEEPFRLGGVAEFLAPAEAARRRDRWPGTLDLVSDRERDVLTRARAHLIESWSDAVPGLDAAPDLAAGALEHLTDLLLSHPQYRREPQYLLETYAWESGVALGFSLIEALGGHWERVQAGDGSFLRVANLGGTGLTWRPLHSSGERLRSGALWAPDLVLGWLRGVCDVARGVYLH